MTAIELLFFVIRICISLGICVVMWSVQPLLGAIMGMVHFLAFPKLVTILAERFGDKPIGKPTCSNGCCHNDDYEWTRSENGIPICKCNCGTEYATDGRQFLKIGSTGHKEPYMVWFKKRGWVKEESKVD